MSIKRIRNDLQTWKISLMYTINPNIDTFINIFQKSFSTFRLQMTNKLKRLFNSHVVFKLFKMNQKYFSF